jgi:site-specific recombinase XerC
VSRRFFKWLAAEDDLPDPMAELHPPTVTSTLVPVFTSQELARLARACVGRSFAQHRDTAIVAVVMATGIRLSELAGIRYHRGTRCLVRRQTLWSASATTRRGAWSTGSPRTGRPGSMTPTASDC